MRPSIAVAALFTALALGGFGTAAAAAQPPSSNLDACYDGGCTLRVTGPVEIPLDGSAGPMELSVSSIGPSGVAVELRSRTGGALGVVGRGGTVRFSSEQGTLAVRVLELGPDAAVIELTTQPG